MPLKIFMGDDCCLAMPPDECMCAYTITCYSLYGHFHGPPSCLLVQCDISCLLRFRFMVQSHYRVIIFVLFQLIFYITFQL